MSIYEEAIITSYAMIKYGNNFIKSLGRIIEAANLANMMKIKNTWLTEWNDFLEIGSK